MLFSKKKRFVPFTLMLSAKENVAKPAKAATVKAQCAILKILPNIPLLLEVFPILPMMKIPFGLAIIT